MENSSDVYNLFEFGHLNDIYIPVKDTARVKYTCFDVSKHFLVVGANSGSLYVFSRLSLQYLQTFSNKDGAIINVRIAPTERYFAFATNKGTAVLLEHKISNGHVGRSNPTQLRNVQVSHEHRGTIITCLQWDEDGTRVFVADTSGKVTSMNVQSKKAKTLFRGSTSLIVKLASQTVQLDFSQDKLLISTLTGCYLCDTAKEQYSQIGMKPRAGDFGACFYKNPHSATPTIYAARPGSRIWEVDFEGSVLCTHQFKKALTQPSVDIVSIRQDRASSGPNTSPLATTSYNFPRLLPVRARYILTWVKEKLFLFDPVSVSVLLWTIFRTDILDVRVWGGDIYVWYSDGKIHNYKLLPVEQGIAILLSNSYWKLGAALCLSYETVVKLAQSRACLPKKAIENLVCHLQQTNESALREKIEGLLLNLEEPEKPPTSVSQNGDCKPRYPIESGIYVVNRPLQNGNRPQTLNGNLRANKLEISEVGVSGSLISSSAGNGTINTSLLDKYKQSLQKVMAAPASSSMPKTASVGDLKKYATERPNLRHRQSFDDTFYGYNTAMPLLMSMSTAGGLWDLDPIDLYSGMDFLKPGAAFDELKSSLSSKYQSGKEQFLSKIGFLEDHFKSLSVEDSVELLDVQRHPVRDTGRSVELPQGDSDVGEDGTFPNSEGPRIWKVNLGPLYEISKVTFELACKWTAEDDPRLLEAVLRWVDVLNATQELMYREYDAQHNPDKNTPLSILPRSKSCIALSTTITSVESDELIMQNLNGSGESWQNLAAKTGLRRKSCSNSDDGKCLMKNGRNEKADIRSGAIPDKSSRPLTLEDILWWQDMEPLHETVLKNVRSEQSCTLCYPKIFAYDPWGSDRAIHKLMQTLAFLCFKTKTFGRITIYCQQVAGFSQVANLRNGDVHNVKSYEQLYTLPSQTGGRGLILDHARAIFVRQFFHLLEPLHTFRELHNDRTYTFQTWKAILRGVIDVREAKCTSYQFSKHLAAFNSLMDALTSKQDNLQSLLQTLMDESDFLTPRDILHVDRITQREGRLFLAYMDAKCQNKKLRGKHRRECQLNDGMDYSKLCEDPVVHLAWFEGLLQSEFPSFQDLKCSCGNPRPWSHLYPWKRKDFILQALYLNFSNRPQCFQICKVFGFWPGYLRLCHKFTSRNEILLYLVQLGDVQILEDPINILLLPKTVEEWTHFFELVLKHNKDAEHTVCLFCNAEMETKSTFRGRNHLSLESAILLMINYYNADTVLKLTARILEAHPEIKLPFSFYRQCMMTVASRQQEVQDSSAWSKRPCAAPQVCSLLLAELNDTSTDDQTLQIPCYNSSLVGIHFEWGITFDPSSLCNSCSLPLMVTVDTSTPGGIRILPCGHKFHLHCISKHTCSICQ